MFHILLSILIAGLILVVAFFVASRFLTWKQLPMARNILVVIFVAYALKVSIFV